MVRKIMEFEATRPILVDARHSTSSPIILSLLLRKFTPQNPEDIIELAIINNKGLFRDVCLWCERTGNKLITSENENGEEDIHCIIQKGQGRGRGKKMVAVLSTVDLVDVVGVLEKAVGGCVLGMEVAVFFEGSGVRLLRTGYRSRCPGLFGRFRTTVIEEELKSLGRLLPRDAIEMLEELGASFYLCGRSMQRFGVEEEGVSVGKFEIASGIMLVDLLSRSDVNLFSKGEFERP
ncbi:hypothetical protein ACEPPN_000848 [Leptodophora sp. 'Broadleaf-Isolate-01']